MADLRGFSRAWDAFTDHRLPHWLPLSLARKLYYDHNLTHGQSEQSGLMVSLTFDVERDPAPNGVRVDNRTSPLFLETMPVLCADEGVEATFFVQGDIVVELADQLRPLTEQHELGLHGFHHELWGRPTWYMTEPPSRRQDRPRLLRLGIAAFRDASLPLPTLFRAPNLVIDTCTFRLLRANGFKLDSSLPSYKGVRPVPHVINGLLSLPVTASPIPRLHWRAGIPTWAPYPLMNIQTFLHSSEEELCRLIQVVAAYQERCRVPCHLIVLGHPWEFYPSAVDPVASSANYERLKRRLTFFRSRFNAKFLALSDVAKCASSAGAFPGSAAAEPAR